MDINRKWASGIGADGSPVYAPKDAIVVGSRTVLGPKDKHYEAAGYKRVVNIPPKDPPSKGRHWEERYYEIEDGEIWRQYEEVDNL